jgi:hypothetical protein
LWERPKLLGSRFYRGDGKNADSLLQRHRLPLCLRVGLLKLFVQISQTTLSLLHSDLTIF